MQKFADRFNRYLMKNGQYGAFVKLSIHFDKTESKVIAFNISDNDNKDY